MDKDREKEEERIRQYLQGRTIFYGTAYAKDKLGRKVRRTFQAINEGRQQMKREADALGMNRKQYKKYLKKFKVNMLKEISKLKEEHNDSNQ